MGTYTFTNAVSFAYRGWYCTMREALCGYKIKAVAMTKRFQIEYSSSLASFKDAEDFKHCGDYREFKVTQMIIGWNRAQKKAKEYIDSYLGNANTGA